MSFEPRPMLPLCPDHRDKCRDLPCRQCAVESLLKSVDLAIDELDPDMMRYQIVQLREKLIRRRSDYEKYLSHSQKAYLNEK